MAHLLSKVGSQHREDLTDGKVKPWEKDTSQKVVGSNPGADKRFFLMNLC